MRLIQLLLVVRVQVVLRELQLVHLIFHLVKVLVHHVRVDVVDLGDVLNALLEVTLVLHEDLALVFVVLEFQSIDAILTLLPLMLLLLVLVVVSQKLLHVFEVVLQFGASLNDVVPKVERYADLLVLLINLGLLLCGFASLAHLIQFEVQLVARKTNLFKLFE